MKKIPKMISTKDLSYICDMFNWHLIAAKKLESYLSQGQEQEITKKIEELCQMHFTACQKLVDLLESENQG